MLLLLIQQFVTFLRILYICLMFLPCINKSDDDDDDDISTKQVNVRGNLGEGGS